YTYRSFAKSNQDGNSSLRAVRSIDLAAVFHDLEAVISSRDLIPRMGKGTAGAPESADQSLARGVVIGLYAFDLDLAANPGDRMHAHLPVDLAGANAVPAGKSHADDTRVK